MKQKCSIEYKDFSRVNKTRSVLKMFSEWKTNNPDEYIRVGVFNPSITCLDLDAAVYNNLIREDTKLIFFENFKYLKNKNDRSEFLFKKKVMTHIPMVKEENVFFHFGDLETLQLGGILSNLCKDKIEKINFMFLDFCGELNANHAKWLYDNRYLISDNSFQFYTVCLQSKLRHDECKKMEFAKDFLCHINYNIYTNEESKIKLDKLQNTVDFWQFNCSTILDTEKRSENYEPKIKPIIYSDGRSLMGIFNGQCKKTEEYLWKFYHGFLHNAFVEKSENIVDDNCLVWDKLNGNKVFTDFEIMMFRDMPIPEIKIDAQYFIDYIQEHKWGRNGAADLRNTIMARFPKSFFPRVLWENPKKYKYSSLHSTRCFMIFNKYFLNKIFLDKKTGKYGKFVLDISFCKNGKVRSRSKYKFEYVSEKEQQIDSNMGLIKKHEYFEKLENFACNSKGKKSVNQANKVDRKKNVRKELFNRLLEIEKNKRKRKETLPKRISDTIFMMKDGMNQSQIAKALNISQPTLSVFIKKFLMKEEFSN